MDDQKNQKINIIINKAHHAVYVAHPCQSHIKKGLQFSKLLHSKGFHITFVNTEFNHKRFLNSKGPHSLDGLPDFRFETIPDGLLPSPLNATQDIPSLNNSIRTNFLSPFLHLLAKLAKDMSLPPITCIVSDGVMPFVVTAGEQLGIPVVYFFTFSACGFMGFKQFKALKDKGLTPLQDESYLSNGYLESEIDWIPGMGKLRLRDLPSFIRTTDPDEPLFNVLMESAEAAAKASAVVVHTFYALETELLDVLSSMFPRLYSIGPLQLLLNRMEEESLKSIEYSLWEEETGCLRWLDSKQPNSVLYVNFGSIAVMSNQHLIEFAMGLANSDNHFLWIIRPDLVIGGLEAMPVEFVEKAKQKGYIASWCPQEEVLNHPSVGGFLTHCGWGSIIESIIAGVPLLCWPFFGDQPTNCRFACNDWGIGLEIDNDVKRKEVEELVRELMEGDKGKEMRSKAQEWKKLANEATGPTGSSSVNLDNLVNELLSLNK